MAKPTSRSSPVPGQVDLALKPDETLLTGEWMTHAQGVIEDATCRRIDHLTRDMLEHVADDATGWESLFRDPADGRYWELCHPRSDLHGGGPPSLRHLTPAQVRAKYKLSLET